MDFSMIKTDGARYTIRFNPADPYHQNAMGILNNAGRRKASLIAAAICAYCGITQEGIRPDSQQVFSVPIAQPTALPTYSQISSDWISVAIDDDCEGGDEAC